MSEKERDSASEGNTYTSSKAEAREFIQNVQRFTEITQARLTGMLEGGLTMWDIINAGNP